MAYTIVTFVTAAGLGYFLYFFYCGYGEKWEFFRDGGVGRGERRGPWGVKPQGPEILMLFFFCKNYFLPVG